MILPHGIVVACTMLAAGAGTLLARRFDGVSLPLWAEGLSVAICGALVLWLGGAASLPHLLWTTALVLPLATLAAIDAATRQLPDMLSWLLSALGVAHLLATGAALATPVAAALFLVLSGLALDRFAPDSPVGAGDFLIAAVAVIWIGVTPLIELALIAAVLVWLHFLLLVLLRLAGLVRTEPGGAPLGPSLAIAIAALWIAAPPPG